MAQRRRTVAQWRGLSERTRARYERNGVTMAMYMRGDNLSAARGHANTPERPERAAKNPRKYVKYVNNPKHARKLTAIEEARMRNIDTYKDTNGVTYPGVYPFFDKLTQSEQREMSLHFNVMMSRGPSEQTGSLEARINLDNLIMRLNEKYDGNLDDDTDSRRWWAAYKESYAVII